MIFSSKALSASITALLFLPMTAEASAITVNAFVSGASGAFAYQYEIENQTALSLLAFSITFTGDLGTIASPTGWVAGTGVPAPGETLVQWISTDVPFDIPPFGTLTGFLITSTDGLGDVLFSTLNENFEQFGGTTVGPVSTPTAVPEPASLVLIGTGFATLVVRARRRAMKAPRI